jgi:hypothetical protein
VKTQKIAIFPAGKNWKPPPFTLPALTMAPRPENQCHVYAIFASHLGLSRRCQ